MFYLNCVLHDYIKYIKYCNGFSRNEKEVSGFRKASESRSGTNMCSKVGEGK